ncbi:leucine-rich repeat domain-containing protein [Levilactobacillus wangkuiensis]|uniref:leucine-rich repeat domain-containing protein n=1 Tax=Levilactobacillus wangkuiensis TaxID=2799566 RepID=UPI00194EBE75|nr:leucine-rich repeat domain-containing protein [Levilactobacillus wangkuiensis]
MRNLKSDSKEHYKSYKAGKHWFFACITVMSLGLGLVGANETAQADTNNASEPATSVVTPAANEQKPAAGDTVDDSESNSDSGALDKVAGSENDAGAVNSDADKDVNQDSNNNVNSDENKDINNDENKDNNAEDANKNVDQDQDVPKNVASDKQDDPSGNVQNQGQPADDQQQPENQQKPEQQVAPVNNVEQESSKDKLNDNLSGNKQEDVSTLGKVKPVVESHSLLRDAAPSIDGIDASVWMPDANLRAWVEGYLSSSWRIEVNDANLSEYVKKATDLYDAYGATVANPNNKTYAGPISSLEGLQYFTNLTTISYDDYVPESGMIDFSFAPNLTSLQLDNLAGTATTGMDINALFSLIANNSKLQWISVTGYGLTGQVPDFSQYSDLSSLHLNNNQLTGDLSGLGTLPNVTSLQLDHNQLTGAIPSLTTLPSLTYLEISNNHLTDIPDLSTYTGIFDISDNNLTSGVQTSLNNWSNILNQTVTGKNYTITPTVRSFDPITDVIKGAQGSDGQIDLSDPMVAYNLGYPGDLYFTVESDPANPIGFNIVVADDTPDGTYTIEAWNQKTHHYEFDLTFTVTNAKDPVVDPGTGTTDPGTGTTDPDTTDPDTNTNPGTGTSTVNPGTDMTTTPDVTVDNSGDADQGVTDTNPAATNTPQTGGDAATIDTTTPAKKQVAKAGQADKLVVKSSRQSAKPVTESKGQAAKVVAPKALASSSQYQADVTTNQAKTTLPQTNERSGASLLAAGIALLIATFGMGLTAKHHE